MILKVLGCGDAFGSGGRFNTSFLLSNGGESILVDCGATTLVRLKQEGVDLESISTIVISHFHGDHYGGIPFFLISSLFEKIRTTTLTIIGPNGVEERVMNLVDAMYPGTSDRLAVLNLQFIEFSSNGSKSFNQIKLTALPVDHSPQSIPHGLRLQWKNKVFAFSGDTSWNDNLIELSNKADLFVCEANFLNDQAFGHLSYEELVSRRDQINCKNIYLTHMGIEVIQLKDSIFPKLEDGMEVTF